MGLVRATRSAAVLICAAAFAGSPAAGAAGDVLFDATLERSSVKLGEDAVLQLTVTNRSSGPVTVPALRLAADSVSVQVGWGGGAPATVTRLYGSFIEEDGALHLQPVATQPRTLGAGDTLQGTVSFPVVVPGNLVLVPMLGPEGPTRVVASPLTLEVKANPGPGRRLSAQVETSRGTFTVDLEGESAFNAVSHFWRLAREGFYDKLPVHRVLPRFLAQSGDPGGDGAGGPGWYLPAEASTDTLVRGDFGFARGAHPDSSGSQWFVVADPQAADGVVVGTVTRLGSVVEGAGVVDLLVGAETAPRTARPKTPDTVVAVRAIQR